MIVELLVITAEGHQKYAVNHILVDEQHEVILVGLQLYVT